MQDGCPVCPYHGWSYNPSGQCVPIPAHPSQPPPTRARATVYSVQEKYGLVWVCQGQATQGVPDFEKWGQESFRKVKAGLYRFVARGPRVVENFLDVGHFPFVHAGLLGDLSHTEISDYNVETTAEGIVARDIGVWQPDPAPLMSTGCSASSRMPGES